MPSRYTTYYIYIYYLDEKDLVYEDDRSAWVYRNSVELKNAPYAGLITMYKGGGYTFPFRRSAAKVSITTINVLQNQIF